MCTTLIRKLVSIIMIVTLPHLVFANDYQKAAGNAVQGMDEQARLIADSKFDQIFQQALIQAYQNLSNNNLSQLMEELVKNRISLDDNLNSLDNYRNYLSYIGPNTPVEVVGKIQKEFGAILNNLRQGLSEIEDYHVLITETESNTGLFIQQFLQQFNLMCKRGLGHNMDGAPTLDFQGLKPQFSIYIPIPVPYEGTDTVAGYTNAFKDHLNDGGNNESEYEQAAYFLSFLGSLVLGAKIATGTWIITTSATGMVWSLAALSSMSAILATAAWTMGILAVVALAFYAVSHFKAVKDSRERADAQRYVFENQATYETVAGHFRDRCVNVEKEINSLGPFLSSYQDDPEKNSQTIEENYKEKIKPFVKYMEIYQKMLVKYQELEKKYKDNQGVVDKESLEKELLETQEHKDFTKESETFNGDAMAEVLYWVLAQSYNLGQQYKKESIKVYNDLLNRLDYKSASKTYSKIRGLYFYLQNKRYNELLGKQKTVEQIEFSKRLDFIIILYSRALVQSLSKDVTHRFGQLRDLLVQLKTDIKKSINISGSDVKFETLNNRVNSLISELDQ